VGTGLSCLGCQCCSAEWILETGCGAKLAALRLFKRASGAKKGWSDLMAPNSH
jgi:hypothetical protein